ncbi:hypothetical protein E1211_15325 [Micromonospora sp. 15K316]|uniref:hypothetical protein n=1 Tax=Micromonospora sp. 15K316 TaxID=2530376 RepID=UPI00104AB3D5|nr:hypothetical protein [Micromonospora sp. 15K316]TDC35675.1 hypothetical protein E1211_15325 [Micromonospora sp. 15K316]
MTVKISAQLTRERKEFNGLDRIERELVDQPRGVRYAVVAFEVKRVSDEIDEGVEIPTIRLSHIEPVDGVQADRVRDMLAERYQDRTGKTLEGDPTLFDVVDGEREVPEPSGAELLAEHREAREASPAPAAEFSGGEQ